MILHHRMKKISIESVPADVGEHLLDRAVVISLLYRSSTLGPRPRLDDTVP
jgi:hypothetical protein